MLIYSAFFELSRKSFRGDLPPPPAERMEPSLAPAVSPSYELGSYHITLAIWLLIAIEFRNKGERKVWDGFKPTISDLISYVTS